METLAARREQFFEGSKRFPFRAACWRAPIRS
jgi:hypothetical protein